MPVKISGSSTNDLWKEHVGQRDCPQTETSYDAKEQQEEGFHAGRNHDRGLIIGILLAIAVPNFITARQNSRAQTIIANLNQIESAKEQCAMNEGLAVGDTCATMAQYMKQWPVTWPVTGAVANETTIGTVTTFRGRNADTWRTNKSGL